MAYIWVRSAVMRPERVLDAMTWAKQVTAYVNTLSEHQMFALYPFTGNQRQILWTCRHESLESLEQWIARVRDDAGYIRMVETAQPGTFIMEMDDNILRILD
ncbi:NIPSNAP protein [Sulfobacillus thermosulfidooxidans DSM 9293]|uniref:NIPSNAP protein n=1 Tax=Sulfobacillus thermosulfidooxidans (strain DSM 9293 / VKM B-1269 / AT-1) TaxID=929705 RepID=A0A1W1WH92_SULTA|nr:NIPSNAP family protein [Sulfobacillus thermosulfidooxidans]SMC05678.1 NIPSNAP protein [Sulfobacillus thermosulfidooxidans DSM 9293]